MKEDRAANRDRHFHYGDLSFTLALYISKGLELSGGNVQNLFFYPSPNPILMYNEGG